MENKTRGETTGIGVCGLLGVAFVILKLCHVIEWPWVWVTAPFWGPVAAVLLFLLGMVVLWSLAKLVKWVGRRLSNG